MSEQAHAIVERRGHVLTITLNRPEARNALSTEMMEIMSSTWDEVNANADIRVAIITGAGGAFCAGADLKAMTRMHQGDSFRQGNAGGLSAGVIKPLPMPMQYIVAAPAAARARRYGEKGNVLGFSPVGQIVGRMNEIRSVKEVVYGMVEDYLAAVERLDKLTS